MFFRWVQKMGTHQPWASHSFQHFWSASAWTGKQIVSWKHTALHSMMMKMVSFSLLLATSCVFSLLPSCFVLLRFTWFVTRINFFLIQVKHQLLILDLWPIMVNLMMVIHDISEVRYLLLQLDLVMVNLACFTVWIGCHLRS